MNKRRKRIVLILVLVMSIFCANSLLTYVIVPFVNLNNSIKIVSPTTWLGGGGEYGSALYDIKKMSNGYIHVNCRVTLQNTSNYDQRVYLAAFMPYEMMFGVNRSAFLYAKLDDHITNRVFYLKPNETKVFYRVCFCGEGNGNLIKMNRLFPWVVIRTTE